MTDKLLSLICERYPLTALDVGDMGNLKANGMRFSVNAYRAEGLGHVSVMRAKGFFGLMKMDTLIINPTEIDLPLYSYDRIFAMGNDTLIVELYDTVATAFRGEALSAVKAQYCALPERDPGVHWYDSIKLPESISKKGKKRTRVSFDELALAHFAAYLTAENGAAFDVTVKRQKAKAYVEGLLLQGGPSTSVFQKALGKERTATLFHTALFGTGL